MHYFADGLGVTAEFDRDNVTFQGDDGSLFEIPVASIKAFVSVYDRVEWPRERVRTSRNGQRRGRTQKESRFHWTKHEGSDECLMEWVQYSTQDPNNVTDREWREIAKAIREKYGTDAPSPGGCQRRYKALKSGEAKPGEARQR